MNRITRIISHIIGYELACSVCYGTLFTKGIFEEIEEHERMHKVTKITKKTIK